MGEEWELGQGRMETEERKGYLYVRLRGEILTVSDVERGVLILRDRMMDGVDGRLDTKKLLFDLRQLSLPLPDDACHAAWDFIHAREYAMLACAMPEAASDLMMTRMNMTGLSESLPFRVFPSIVEAHRWLDFRPSGIHRRPSSFGMSAVTPPRAEAGRHDLLTTSEIVEEALAGRGAVGGSTIPPRSASDGRGGRFGARDTLTPPHAGRSSSSSSSIPAVAPNTTAPPPKKRPSIPPNR